MSCCCQKVHRVCDVHVCTEDLILPIPIATEGTHTLELEFLGQTVLLTGDFGEGDNATFPTADLNEGFTYVGRLLDPLGATLSFTVVGVVYDCVEFTTKKALPYADPAI